MTWHTAFRISHQVNHDLASVEMNMVLCTSRSPNPDVDFMLCVRWRPFEWCSSMQDDFVDDLATVRMQIIHCFCCLTLYVKTRIWSCECSFRKMLCNYTHTYEHTHIHIIMQYENHQCILWMTHAHSYTRCGSFLMRRRSYWELRGKAYESNDHAKKKHSWHSLVHLLQSVVSSLLQTLHGCRDARSGDLKACARTHAPHHPIAHTTARPGHALRQVEKRLRKHIDTIKNT